MSLKIHLSGSDSKAERFRNQKRAQVFCAREITAIEEGTCRGTIEKYLALPESANPSLSTLVAAMQMGLTVEDGGMLVGRRATPSFEND